MDCNVKTFDFRKNHNEEDDLIIPIEKGTNIIYSEVNNDALRATILSTRELTKCYNMFDAHAACYPDFSCCLFYVKYVEPNHIIKALNDFFNKVDQRFSVRYNSKKQFIEFIKDGKKVVPLPKWSEFIKSSIKESETLVSTKEFRLLLILVHLIYFSTIDKPIKYFTILNIYEEFDKDTFYAIVDFANELLNDSEYILLLSTIYFNKDYKLINIDTLK